MKNLSKSSVTAAVLAVSIVCAAFASLGIVQDVDRIANSPDVGAESPDPMSSSNGVTKLLTEAICNSRDTLAHKADNEHERQQIAWSCCRAMLAIMTPDQQKAYIQAVQFDANALRLEPWGGVGRSIQLSRKLLTVTAAQERMAIAAMGTINERKSNPSDSDKAASGFLGLSPEQKEKEFSLGKASHALDRHCKWLDAVFGKACKDVRATLDPWQRAEWDEIWNFYRQNLPNATR